MSQGYRKYSQAYQKAAVHTMDQKKLIVMLYDGAIKFLSIASKKIKEGDYYESHNNMVRGKSIIAELLASLNMEQGGDIATNLQKIYAFMFNELIDANLGKDHERVDRVIQLLQELRDAWRGLQVPREEKSSPDQAQQGNGRTKSINVRG